MTLFALTDDPEAHILRFPLSQELRNEIGNAFASQRRAFLTGIAEVHEFDGSYAAEGDELLSISNFAGAQELVEAAAQPLSVPAFDPETHSLNQVKALFMNDVANNAQRTERLAIQLFERRRVISSNGLALFFSRGTFTRIQSDGLTLDTKLVAVIERRSLKFKSFAQVRRIFDLTQYFNEATNDEIETFAAHDKLHVADVEGFVAAASQLTRKKIALISRSDVLERHTVPELIAAAGSLGLRIERNRAGQMVLPSNKTELRAVLKFLDEDYYKSSLSDRVYISNSKRTAG